MIIIVIILAMAMRFGRENQGGDHEEAGRGAAIGRCGGGEAEGGDRKRGGLCIV